MRITFVTFGRGLGGGDRDILRLANLLKKRKHIVRLLRPKKRYNNPLLIAIDVIRRIPRSDIIVAVYSLSAPMAWIAEKMGKGKAFYFIWHFEPIFFYKSRDTWKKMAALVSYRIFPTERMIANSKWVAWMIYKIRREEVKIVNPGIDHSVFYPRAKQDRKEKIEKIILTIARREKWRGLEDFIIAINAVRKQMPVKIIMVSKQKEVAETASRCGAEFILSPSDEELAYLYSMCDVFVHTSWYEGFGLPQLESMACGTPVVMTDSLGVRDYAVNEVNCLLVPPRKPKKLVEAIMKCLRDRELAQSISQNGLVTASRFDPERTANELLEILNEILDARILVGEDRFSCSS